MKFIQSKEYLLISAFYQLQNLLALFLLRLINLMDKLIGKLEELSELLMEF